MVTGKRITPDEKKRLAIALKEAKAKTSARIRLTVVYVSDKYPLYSLVYGAFAGTLVLGLLALFVPALSLREGFCMAVGTTVVVTALLDWLPLRLMFIPRRAKFWECWELAHRAFASRILARNDRKTGVLLFVSLGEHYVEVVTDRDVDRHLRQGEWDRLIAAFTARARRGEVGEGLIELVDASGTLLAGVYPPV